MKLVLFDLDNTLLAGDSDFEWAQYLIEQGALDGELHAAQNRTFYEQYQDGTLNIQAFLNFQLAPLSRHPREQLDRWRSEFVERRIVPIIAARSNALISSHSGALIAIITATNSFITRPIADVLNVAHLIATEPEERDGQFTGGVAGTPCFREGKVSRLNEWLAARRQTLAGFESSWFYSDSLNDLPLLSVVTHPVAVDPDPTLQAHAGRLGWPVISLR